MSKEMITNPDIFEEIETEEEIKERYAIFAEIWRWMEKRINRINILKGWIKSGRGNERNDGELIALIHAEISEALEALRKGNPTSKKIKAKEAEEELADAIIRIMDMAYTRKWNIPKALAKKLEYNKTRPYRHGGKRF